MIKKKLEQYVGIRITEEDKNRATKVANEKGMTLGTYARFILMKEVEKEESK